MQFILVAVALLAPAYFAFVRRPKNLYEFVPSFVWFFLGAIPFLYLYPYLIQTRVQEQAFGIFSVLIAFVLADYVAWRIRRSQLENPASSDPNAGSVPALIEKAAVYLLAAVTIAVPILHIALAGDAPITHIFDPGDNLGAERENFSKLLIVSYFVKVLFAWHTSIVSTLLFSYLVIKGRYRLAALVMVWSVGYAAISLARLPAVMFVFISAFVIIHYRATLLASLLPRLAVGLMTVFVVAGIYRGEVLLAFYSDLDPELIKVEQRGPWEHSQTVDGIPVSPGDIERLDVYGRYSSSSFGYLGDYAIYRAFLSPMEVANRWYGFFPDHSNGWRNVGDLVAVNRGPDWKHAANRVAEWAYASRFPSRYLPSAHAYAAADSDAYSFGGWQGILVCSVLIFLLRAGIAWLAGPSGLSRIIYLACVALFAALPFQASLQAILLSHGTILLIGMLAALWAIPRLFGRRTAATSG